MLKRYARIYAPGGKYSPISRGKETLGPHIWGALCSGTALNRAPTKWSGSVSMFTSLSVTSVLILIQGRTLVESSSQGSEGCKQWKSSWLPSARKGPLEALSYWMGQGSHDHPWEGCRPAPELGLWLLSVAWGSPTHAWTQWGRDVCWYSVAQSCLTFCEPVNGSLLGSSVHGIFQAKILE